MVHYRLLKRLSHTEQELLEQITLLDFLQAYNENMPERFPRVTVTILKKFKEAHPSFFKHGDLWSLNLHRKKIMDWLPLNGDPV